MMKRKNKNVSEADVVEKETVNNEQPKDNQTNNEVEDKSDLENEKQNNETEGSELESLNIKNQELNDKFLRLYSEFDNYRKRTIKEKNELSKFASMQVITDLLPVLDDFDRALKNISFTEENKSIIEGIELIYNKLYKVLELQGLEPIIAVGEEFNTDFHEAVTKVPAQKDDMKGKVFDEIQKGYMIYDKVVRYSKVVVAE